jgi:dipeptidyl aminopeptidase/acylaminoacyl peptidase
VPAIRGERLLLAGHEWRAEGDRTDGWDGGAEDALALLAAATTIDHRIDRSRACVFGRSRGGAVALLVGERDTRLRCVVAISPPVDWFDAMWAGSWPKTTLLRAALRNHAGPFDPGGQFVEWIMKPIAEGRWGLADARRRMLAMSPVYYVDRLPATLALFGREDPVVVVRNAIMLDAAFHHGHPRSVDQTVVVMDMAGHDTDPVIANRLIGAFLARHLRTLVGQPEPGGDAR